MTTRIKLVLSLYMVFQMHVNDVEPQYNDDVQTGDPCSQSFGKAGNCLALVYKWSYNQKENKCKQFIYGGCGGNANSFESFAECSNKCQPVQDFGRTGTDPKGDTAGVTSGSSCPYNNKNIKCSSLNDRYCTNPKYASWMIENCAKTCKCGGSSCPYTNKNIKCSSLNKHYCTNPKYASWMVENCAKTCKCGGSSCPYTNKNIRCSSLNNSYCTNPMYDSWMIENCPKTCKCGDGKGSNLNDENAKKKNTEEEGSSCPYTNKNIRCSSLNNHYCTNQKYASWMIENCPKTCKCGDGKGSNVNDENAKKKNTEEEAKKKKLGVRWSSELAEGWSDDKCKNLGIYEDLEVFDCKNKCEVTPFCTAINYGTTMTKHECILRGCILPIELPDIFGYKGYYLQELVGIRKLFNCTGQYESGVRYKNGKCTARTESGDSIRNALDCQTYCGKIVWCQYWAWGQKIFCCINKSNIKIKDPRYISGLKNSCPIINKARYGAVGGHREKSNTDTARTTIAGAIGMQGKKYIIASQDYGVDHGTDGNKKQYRWLWNKSNTVGYGTNPGSADESVQYKSRSIPTGVYSHISPNSSQDSLFLIPVAVHDDRRNQKDIFNHDWNGTNTNEKSVPHERRSHTDGFNSLKVNMMLTSQKIIQMAQQLITADRNLIKEADNRIKVSQDNMKTIQTIKEKLNILIN